MLFEIICACKIALDTPLSWFLRNYEVNELAGFTHSLFRVELKRPLPLSSCVYAASGTRHNPHFY